MLNRKEKYPWKRSPVLSLEEIERFEEKAGIKLPIDSANVATTIPELIQTASNPTLHKKPDC